MGEIVGLCTEPPCLVGLNEAEHNETSSVLTLPVEHVSSPESTGIRI